MKKHIIPVIFLLVNFIFLATFGTSFNLDLFMTNIYDFIFISTFISLTILVALKYDFIDYVKGMVIFNDVAIIYMVVRYLIHDYSWSGLVPTIGYYYIIIIGFVLSSIYQIYNFLKK
jgi:hypothetical protein